MINQDLSFCVSSDCRVLQPVLVEHLFLLQGHFPEHWDRDQLVASQGYPAYVWSHGYWCDSPGHGDGTVHQVPYQTLPVWGASTQWPKTRTGKGLSPITGYHVVDPLPTDVDYQGNRRYSDWLGHIQLFGADWPIVCLHCPSLCGPGGAGIEE